LNKWLPACFLGRVEAGFVQGVFGPGTARDSWALGDKETPERVA
jgi:hypothetical protein